jgi:hypothetical protein
LAIISRKQWRYLDWVNSWADDNLVWRKVEHTREEIQAALSAADYDTLPEKAGDCTAKPMPKADKPRACACGVCGLTFTLQGGYRKYHPECPNRTKKRAKVATPRPTLTPPRAYYDTAWGIWVLFEEPQVAHSVEANR